MNSGGDICRWQGQSKEAIPGWSSPLPPAFPYVHWCPEQQRLSCQPQILTILTILTATGTPDHAMDSWWAERWPGVKRRWFLCWLWTLEALLVIAWVEFCTLKLKPSELPKDVNKLAMNWTWCNKARCDLGSSTGWLSLMSLNCDWTQLVFQMLWFCVPRMSLHNLWSKSIFCWFTPFGPLANVLFYWSFIQREQLLYFS